MRIELVGLTKRYSSRVALDDVSLVIEPGQIVAAVGANGAGKTTLLRCLGAVAAPDRGKILYDDEPFERGRVDLRKRLAFLPEVPFVHAGMSVLGHIGLVMQLYGTTGEGVEETVIELLMELGMLPLAEMPFGKLSRGQAYKGAMAALFAASPELLIFDEPFASGMDPQGLAAFRRRARAAADLGHTVIYTTQLLELAENFCDRVCILHCGRVLAYGSVEHLRSQLDLSDERVLESIFTQLHEADL
ncbi:MAG TPA: ABC transporter ATP-binding protein [Pirellulales bacterium]|jgi:ABC-type multidrug transport system ATPase subunit|nr:ABC transporter ATP-binding protein [Pirellulales bacterium]